MAIPKLENVLLDKVIRTQVLVVSFTCVDESREIVARTIAGANRSDEDNEDRF